MKFATSVSLGSSERDKRVEMELLGQPVTIERRGTDGDLARATALFSELDGKVDALGVGGIDLWIEMEGRKHPLHAAHKLVRGVKNTPLVDGSGLKNTLEGQVVDTMIDQLGPAHASGRVLLTAAVDRYGMTLAFFERDYQVVCGDLMFGLGVPIAVRSLRHLKILARLMLPIVGRLPISVLYPTGEKQDEIIPRFGKHYRWATVIAGDCHYIKRHMPDDLNGKVIVTNTTTMGDMATFKERGVRQVVTTTPQVEGRSFGTNMMEAALTAVSGKGRALTHNELSEMLEELKFTPTVHHL